MSRRELLEQAAMLDLHKVAARRDLVLEMAADVARGCYRLAVTPKDKPGKVVAFETVPIGPGGIIAASNALRTRIESWT